MRTNNQHKNDSYGSLGVMSSVRFINRDRIYLFEEVGDTLNCLKGMLFINFAFLI